MERKNFTEIIEALDTLELPEVDLVVGIAKGGIVPAYLISEQLNKPVEFIHINFRDRTHKPVRSRPKQTGIKSFDETGKTVLLVDDRMNTGSTMKLAKEILCAAKMIFTFTINGPSDYSLFDEACFKMPWQMD